MGSFFGGKGGGGGGSNALNANQIKDISRSDRDLSLIGSQNTVGGQSYYIDPKTGMATQYNQLGQQGQGIADKSLAGLNKDIDFSNLTNETLDIARKDLAPQFEQDKERLEQRLASQGIPLGSQAYDRAIQGLSDNQGRQLNQYALSGREQEANLQLKQRQQQGSELANIMALSEGKTPNVQSPNTAGNINNAYANQQSAAANSPFNQLLSGGVTLGAAALMSDIREKKEIHVLGKTKNGLNIISYIYKDDPEQRTNIGLSAQEVEKKNPEAVHEDKEGTKYVDYKKALETNGRSKTN